MNSAAKEYSIFLSYATSDASWVREFAAALQTEGIHGLVDSFDFPPGDSFENTLETALRQSDTLIVFFSPNSLENPSVFFELGVALADDKKLISVLLGNIDEKLLPFALARQHWVRGGSPRQAAQRVARIINESTQSNSIAH